MQVGITWWLRCAQHHAETRLCISLPFLVSFIANIARKRPELNRDKTNQLEAALATTDTTRQRLLESLLHEALETATEVREAAE